MGAPRFWHWPQLHNDIVQKLLHKARKGTQVVYIPGNYDELVRGYVSTRSILITPHALRTTTDGQQLLVLHGEVIKA